MRWMTTGASPSVGVAQQQPRSRPQHPCKSEHLLLAAGELGAEKRRWAASAEKGW
ncbi:hypothetical protein [Streptomyces sp. NPDC086766]|uniref:hypothetical protein n=1 Tax=Streptomyces sp. NPDC086766 TaxID=3365754 RepID=UPI00382C0D8D